MIAIQSALPEGYFLEAGNKFAKKVIDGIALRLKGYRPKWERSPNDRTSFARCVECGRELRDALVNLLRSGKRLSFKIYRYVRGVPKLVETSKGLRSVAKTTKRVKVSKCDKKVRHNPARVACHCSR